MKKKKFTEIYQEIFPEYLSMKELRKKRNKMAIINTTSILTIVILAIKLYWNIFENRMPINTTENFIYFIGIFILVLFYIKISTNVFDSKIEYNSMYKEKIIRPLIESYNGKLKYEPLGTEIESLYKIGNYEYYDLFFSEDYIHGDNIKMSEIRTEQYDYDVNGRKQKYIKFEGLFCVFETQKFVTRPIEITFDRGLDSDIILKKVLMDSGVFEKYFDVSGAEKIEVMQILTAEVMELLLKVKKNCKCKFEISLLGNKILIRFFTGNVFEAENPGEEMIIEHLKYYYDIIDNSILLSEHLVNAVNQCEL